MTSLWELDPKRRTQWLLGCNINTDVNASKSRHVSGLWTIDDFLTESVCDTLVEQSTLLAEPVGPGHERSIVFDSTIVDAVEHQLTKDKFWTRFRQRQWHPPPTFDPNQQFHVAYTPRCNPCVRLHHYQPGASAFGWHRDAAYVQSQDVRSNYTLLVYLTDDDGGTEFRESQGPFDGRRIDQEIFLSDSVMIRSVKGMAVVFDQRLVHRGIVNQKGRSVMRLDVMAFATVPSKARPLHPAEVKAMEWFRTAQMLELQHKRDEAMAWYERVGNLRAGGHECCLELQACDPVVLDHGFFSETSVLEFVERTATSYTFAFETLSEALIRAAVRFVMVTECCRYDESKWRQHMRDAMHTSGVTASTEPHVLGIVPSACVLYLLVQRLLAYEEDLVYSIARMVDSRIERVDGIICMPDTINPVMAPSSAYNEALETDGILEGSNYAKIQWKRTHSQSTTIRAYKRIITELQHRHEGLQPGNCVPKPKKQGDPGLDATYIEVALGEACFGGDACLLCVNSSGVAFLERKDPIIGDSSIGTSVCQMELVPSNFVLASGKVHTSCFVGTFNHASCMCESPEYLYTDCSDQVLRCSVREFRYKITGRRLIITFEPLVTV